MPATDPSHEARTSVIDWVEHILERKKWNGTDLSRHADLAPSTVLRLLNDKKHRFVPSLKTLYKISNASGYPIPKTVTELLGGIRGDNVEADGEPTQRRSSGNTQASRSRAMIDVRHVSALPTSLHPTTRAEVTIVAPIQLEGDETAFAFYMPDAALDPWFKAGTLMYATKRRDPVAGDMVLITDGNGRSKVRLLLQIDEQGISLSDLQPAVETDKVGYGDLQDIAIVAVIAKI